MNEIPIHYETFTVPVVIDGPCPVCHLPFHTSDSITIVPPITHRACDPTSRIIDRFMLDALADMAAQLDQNMP